MTSIGICLIPLLLLRKLTRLSVGFTFYSHLSCYLYRLMLTQHYRFMYRLLFLLLPFTAVFSLLQAQDVRVYKADALMERVAAGNDTLYILNFWATWCVPCVKEMPEFNRLHQLYKDRPVKILLVSLDFKEAVPHKLIGFIKKRKILPEVVWLDETDANSFIPKIEESWEGSIPATLLLYSRQAYRKFFEGMVTAEQLRMLTDRQLAL